MTMSDYMLSSEVFGQPNPDYDTDLTPKKVPKPKSAARELTSTWSIMGLGN